MKKLLVVIIALALVICCFGCSNKNINKISTVDFNGINNDILSPYLPSKGRVYSLDYIPVERENLTIFDCGNDEKLTAVKSADNYYLFVLFTGNDSSAAIIDTVFTDRFYSKTDFDFIKTGTTSVKEIKEALKSLKQLNIEGKNCSLHYLLNGDCVVITYDENDIAVGLEIISAQTDIMEHINNYF